MTKQYDTHETSGLWNKYKLIRAPKPSSINACRAARLALFVNMLSPGICTRHLWLSHFKQH
jgi:hypothetical protein